MPNICGVALRKLEAGGAVGQCRRARSRVLSNARSRARATARGRAANQGPRSPQGGVGCGTEDAGQQREAGRLLSFLDLDQLKDELAAEHVRAIVRDKLAATKAAVEKAQTGIGRGRQEAPASTGGVMTPPRKHRMPAELASAADQARQASRLAAGHVYASQTGTRARATRSRGATSGRAICEEQLARISPLVVFSESRLPGADRRHHEERRIGERILSSRKPACKASMCRSKRPSSTSMPKPATARCSPKSWRPSGEPGEALGRNRLA